MSRSSSSPDLSLDMYQQPTLDKGKHLLQLHQRLDKYFILKRLRAMNATGTVITAPRGGTVKLQVSIRLSSNMTRDIPASALCSDFIDMNITTNSEDYMDSPGIRSNSILCSLLVQIGSVFGLETPTHEYDFTRTSQHWCLRRSALAGRWESKAVERLKDIVNGDQLVLDCGKHWAFAVNRDYLKGLPFKNLVKVSLISPLIKPPQVVAKTVGSMAPALTSGKKNINISVVNKSLLGMPLKSAGSFAHNCRRYVSPFFSGNKSINEVLVICSDDESDYSSDVEDVTDEWKARRDEHRRYLKATAEEIE